MLYRLRIKYKSDSKGIIITGTKMISDINKKYGETFDFNIL